MVNKTKKKHQLPAAKGRFCGKANRKMKLVDVLRCMPPKSAPQAKIDPGWKAAKKHKAEMMAPPKKKKKAAAQQIRTLYREGDRILVVGDGNCSFSSSLAENFECGPTLLCTTYDDEETLHKKYPDAQDNIKTVKDYGGDVLHDIDCTKLANYKEITRTADGKDAFYDRIIFHFPHVGLGIKAVDRNILANQKLIVAFFKSAAPLLTPQGEIHVTVKKGEPYDSWRVPALGTKEADLKLRAGYPFLPETYPGYCHRRTLGHAEGISTSDNEDIGKGARTYIFVNRQEEEEQEEVMVSHKRKRAAENSDDSDDDN